MILTGHGLLQALDFLGYEEVPVQVLRHLTEAQKQTYIIADNQLALNSSWDEEKLGLTLQKLENDLVNLEVEMWDRAMAVALRGPMICCKHAVPLMVKPPLPRSWPL